MCGSWIGFETERLIAMEVIRLRHKVPPPEVILLPEIGREAWEARRVSEGKIGAFRSPRSRVGLPLSLRTSRHDFIRAQRVPE
jgi:hypothetical protein